MMSMMGALLNQPKLKPENLEIIEVLDKEGDVISKHIAEKKDTSAIYVDQTMSMLLPMMTTMGDSGSGKSDNMNMMLPMVMIMSQQNQGTTGNNNNTMMPLVMMMMMNK